MPVPHSVTITTTLRAHPVYLCSGKPVCNQIPNEQDCLTYIQNKHVLSFRRIYLGGFHEQSLDKICFKIGREYIESDRHSGSKTAENCLMRAGRKFQDLGDFKNCLKYAQIFHS